MAGIQVNYDRNKRRIGHAARSVLTLAEGYPSVSRRVVEVLSVALAVVFWSGYTVLAAAFWLAWIVGLVMWRRRPQPPVPEPEPEPTPVDWFDDVCVRAKVPVPLVKDHWPTEKGHAFYLLITEWVQREGRPMTVGAWLEFAPLLRDVAGIGCRYVAPQPDEDNGGFGTVEFWGPRLEPYVPPEPEPVPDPGPSCQHRDCEVRPIVHLWLSDDPEPLEGWFCATHADIYEGQAIDLHDFAPSCVEAEWWWPSAPGAPGCCGAAPLPDATDRECTPPLEPLSPQRILPIFEREGREVVVATLPPPDPTTRRPKGAEPGSKGGAMLDLLATAGGPLRRGTLAEAADLSPTTVDKLLTAWADLGVAVKVGSLWTVSTSYRSSGMLSLDGQEDEHS